MKSVAIFQTRNRLIDGVYTNIKKGIEDYNELFGEGIVFIWDCINDVPEAILNSKNVTDADVTAMYDREKHWTPTTMLIKFAQNRIDTNKNGIYHGVHLIKLDDGGYLAYSFIIEIRHIHE